jgi:dephospho-CoA kinase
MAPFVGLTGGLGAGKSEALRILDELGASTLSTDAVVHELLTSDDVQRAVAERFGADVASDRGLIAERVFGDDGERAWLEGLLWPLVGKRVAAWRSSLPADRVAVVEVPLLFESGMEEVFDATIAVIADEATREQRAAARGHAAVAERAGRQLSQAQKAERADFTVRNDGSLDELKQTLSLLLEKIESL